MKKNFIIAFIFLILVHTFIPGERAQTMNVHLLKHLPQCAKMYGPLFGFSCFGFESMNSYLKSMVHGTRHINKQVEVYIQFLKMDKLYNQL